MTDVLVITDRRRSYTAREIRGADVVKVRAALLPARSRLGAPDNELVIVKDRDGEAPRRTGEFAREVNHAA
jgi:hypothetical protein